MESCNVCDSTTDPHYCENCYDAVYCGEACQRADWEEHSKYECRHPDQLTNEEIADEIMIHSKYPDDDHEHDHEIFQIGASIETIDAKTRSRFSEWWRNRKVKRKSGKAGRSTRSLNREKRRANRQARTARRAARKQRANLRAQKRRDRAVTRRDQRQDTVLNN